MTGKKKKKKTGRKGHGDKVMELNIEEKLENLFVEKDQGSDAPAVGKSELESDSSPNLVEVVEPLLSLGGPSVAGSISLQLSTAASVSTSCAYSPEVLAPSVASTFVTSKAAPLDEKNCAAAPFVFTAGQSSGNVQDSSAPVAFSARANELTAMRGVRNSKQYARRREGKCPPSERFGRMGRSGQQIFQLAAHDVAFGQGRDPLSLVVSYEENRLRRVVRAPEGCTSETVVDSGLRQAVACAALDSAGWQQALNCPREEGYFTYSTVPEGLTINNFRESKGKILVTPLTSDCGLLKLKEVAEKKRKVAEEKLNKVKAFLQRLQLQHGHKEGTEAANDNGSNCANCTTMMLHVQELLTIITESRTDEITEVTEDTDFKKDEKQQLAAPVSRSRVPPVQTKSM